MRSKTRTRLPRARWILLLLLPLLIGFAAPASAQEYSEQEEPPVGDVREQRGPFRRLFDQQRKLPSLFPGLEEKLKDAPPFFRDAEFSVDLRNFYFRRDTLTKSTAEAWAQSLAPKFRSGEIGDTFSVGAQAWRSQKIIGDKDRPGAGLLETDQDSFNVLGEAYGQLRFGDHVFRGYRQSYNLPYVNRNDIRQVPVTHEGYSIEGPLFGNQDPESESGSRYILGHILKIKPVADDDFISIRQATGTAGGKTAGLSMAGVLYAPNETFHVGVLNLASWDIFNTLYAEAGGSVITENGTGLQLDLQFTDQRSMGGSRDGDFDTQSWGARVGISRYGLLGTLAFTQTTREADIQNPYGGDPSFISLMRKDFNLAGEESWLVGLGYDFGEIGLPGLSAYTRFARGSNIKGKSFTEEHEFDFTGEYRLLEGPFRGLSLKVRTAFFEEIHGSSGSDLRVILNYNVPWL